MLIKRSSHYPSLIDAEKVADQVINGEHKTSERTKEFEDKICQYIGGVYAKATNSGTNALHLALLSLNVKENHEVIIPTFVCQALMNAVNYTRAKPVFADIGDNFNISAETIRKKINRKTKAIVVPHMFGVPAELDEIKELGIPIIEDCAHSLGGNYKGKKLGSIGDISIFSFYATKMISTGQGGMVLTSNKKLADKVKDLTTYDGRKKYKVAYNYDMSDINASIGISQLDQLNDFLNRRREIEKRYNEEFINTNLILPKVVEGSVPYRYVIRTEDEKGRKKLESLLKKKEIFAEKPVFKLLHDYMKEDLSYPNAEKAYSTALTIPLYPYLTEENISYVVYNLLRAVKKI